MSRSELTAASTALAVRRCCFSAATSRPARIAASARVAQEQRQREGFDMTERQWQTCNDPRQMLAYMRRRTTSAAAGHHHDCHDGKQGHERDGNMSKTRSVY